MELEPLYRIVFATPEAYDGGERLFLVAEGRCEGRLHGRYRAANYARKLGDGSTLVPDFRGAIETDDGATILFAWNGLAPVRGGRRVVLGGMTHETADERYTWLNGIFAVVAGEVRERGGGGFEVAVDVAELRP